MRMRITIAGYGTIGHYVEQVFRRLAEISIYDPPLGFVDERPLHVADFVFVCVPTVRLPGGACDTSIVEEIVWRASPRRAIVCHSTVSIGTTDRLIAETGRPLVFAPEYAGESPHHPMRDPAARDFFIYGGYEPAVGEVRDLFVAAYGPGPQHRLTDPRTAEIVKYMENAFLATKVAFCNEFFELCGAVGADYEQVRSLWLLDPRINPSHTVVTRERGFGGQCLPKDLAAVIETARELGAPMRILEAVQAANEEHRAAAAERRAMV